MKLGMIVRAEDRGLGNMTWEAARHLMPDRVIVVDMPPSQREYLPPKVERYRQLGITTMIVPYEEMGTPHVVGGWLAGLDVVYSAETFYNDGFIEAARARGVKTILHAMPEFYGNWRDPARPQPDVLWLPTSWMAGHPNLPTIDRIMTVPVPIDRWSQPTAKAAGDGTLRLLHVAGTQAMADRNGTRALLAAIRHVTEPMHLTVTAQGMSMPRPGRLPRHVEYRGQLGNQRDYWSMYDGFHALVLPRRYGGLCLPAQEAMGAGLALVMTDLEPQRRWPIVPVSVDPGSTITCALDDALPTHAPSVIELASTLSRLARDRDELAARQADARWWAETHSWGDLGPIWRRALAAVAQGWGVAG